MSNTSDTYTTIIKGIQSSGLNVKCTTDKITATCPITRRVVFTGTIDEAENYLGLLDNATLPQYVPQPFSQVRIVQTPPYRSNSIFWAAASIMFIMVALLIEGEAFGIITAIWSIISLFTSLYYTFKHFQWEKSER